MRFLAFRLYAPLCSFGDVAVGERRPSLSAPSRSMLLGVVGACLGVAREDAEGQAELERSLGVATRTDSPGSLLVDYHTAQAPDGTRLGAYRKLRGHPAATRREELAATFDRDGSPHPLGTQLSQRQYRVDGAYAGCLWLLEEPSRWKLEEIAEGMRRPQFVPYAGRKAAVLAMPFQPAILDAPDPVSALRAARFELDGELRRVLAASKERSFRWEGDWPGLVPARTEARRDRVASRARWQFTIREEHVLTETIEAKEGGDVLEPDRAGA